MDPVATTYADLPLLEVGSVPEPLVGRHLAERGAVVVVGHDADAAQQQALLAAGREAFALPPTTKARYEGPLDGTQRGHLPFRTTLPDGRPARDRKASWHVRPPSHPVPNLLPDEVPAFSRAMLDFAARMHALAGWALDGIDAFLGRSASRLRAACEGGDTLLRICQYPPLEASEGAAQDVTAFEAHEDFDLITLLPGTNGAGLEILGRDGVWRAVGAPADGVIVIAGGLLALESGGAIPATTHRVIAPRLQDDAAADRMSLVYFAGPRGEVVLSDGRGAGTVLRQWLRRTGYA